MLFEKKNALQKKELKSHVLLRYLLRELSLYFFIAFVFFFLIFFVNQLLLTAEELLKKRVPLLGVIKLLSYSLPFIIAQSAPFATLVGFLMCLGRLMSDNEILIFRATGNSYKVILLPVLLLGVIISLLSFFVNDYLLPLGNIKYNELYQEILISNPAIELESHSIKRTNNSTLVIGEVTDKTVSDLILFDTDTNGNQRIIVSGSTDIVSPSDPAVLMQLKMDDSLVIFLDKKVQDSFDVLESDATKMNIFASSIFRNTASSTNPREMTFIDLREYLKKIKADSTVTSTRINMYELEYNKKFSLPFGSFFFAMLAMPLAIIFGKRNGQTIGLIIGIVISVLYWALLILGQTFGFRNGFNGFWAMWLPNILVGSGGIIFYFRLLKK